MTVEDDGLTAVEGADGWRWTWRAPWGARWHGPKAYESESKALTAGRRWLKKNAT